MESNFFRCLARELADSLLGARIEKVFAPDPAVTTFVLHTHRATTHLILRHGKRDQALFLSDHKPDNPANPPAHAMLLRKLAKGRRLGRALIDWPRRRLAFPLTSPEAPKGEGYLLLDMERPPMVFAMIEEGFGQESAWPALADVVSGTAKYTDYPQLSPPLRKELELLEKAGGDAASFYAALQAGGCSTFSRKEGEGSPLPWFRPGKKAELNETALDAARAHFSPLVFSEVQKASVGDAEARVRARAKRIRRTLRKFEQELARLETDLERGREAGLLQARLYAVEPSARLAELELEDFEGGRVSLALDPEKTLRENMQARFKRAAKARRGIAALTEKRAAAEAELSALESGHATPPPVQVQPRQSGKGSKAGKKAGSGRLADLPVTRYRSSGGFLILRGKNARANHCMLSEGASPFDYWFHAMGGPGAHVILKRDHPGQEVDETSMHEAAALAGLKSWQATEPKAEVMAALVKDVRKAKGLAHGQVRVDNLLGSYRVALDPELEIRLAVEG